MPILLLGAEVREITLNDLNAEHLFKIKALKNLELFNGEQLNRGGSGTYLLKLHKSNCSFVVHTSFSTAWQRQEAGIPTHPQYSWFLQSRAEHLHQTRNS